MYRRNFRLFSAFFLMGISILFFTNMGSAPPRYSDRDILVDKIRDYRDKTEKAYAKYALSRHAFLMGEALTRYGRFMTQKLINQEKIKDCKDLAFESGNLAFSGTYKFHNNQKNKNCEFSQTKHDQFIESFDSSQASEDSKNPFHKKLKPKTGTITCSSTKYKYNHCEIKGLVSEPVLTKKYSSSSCQKGKSYGVSETGIWVNHGCRALFSYKYEE